MENLREENNQNENQKHKPRDIIFLNLIYLAMTSGASEEEIKRCFVHGQFDKKNLHRQVKYANDMFDYIKKEGKYSIKTKK